MSSMRNAVNRRVHRERAQPAERARLGLLEKHKDYSARARDYNKKKEQLKALKRKAADRNPDEFYFGMVSREGRFQASASTSDRGRRWKGTVAGDRGNAAMDVDAVRLLKTQDMGYIRTARNVAAKEARRLEERVLALGGSLDGQADAEEEDDDFDDFDGMFGGGGGDDDGGAPSRKPNKTVFADDVESRERAVRDAEEAGAEMDLESDGDGDDKEAGVLSKKERAEQRKKQLERAQRRLQLARKKLRSLAAAENELELQRARMAKTATSAGNSAKSGKKLKVRERKR